MAEYCATRCITLHVCTAVAVSVLWHPETSHTGDESAQVSISRPSSSHFSITRAAIEDASPVPSPDTNIGTQSEAVCDHCPSVQSSSVCPLLSAHAPPRVHDFVCAGQVSIKAFHAAVQAEGQLSPGDSQDGDVARVLSVVRHATSTAMPANGRHRSLVSWVVCAT